MRLRFILFIFSFLILFWPSYSWAFSFSFPNEITEKIGPLKTLGQIEDKRALLQEKENFLEVEQNKTFIEEEELKEMENLFLLMSEDYQAFFSIPAENEEEKNAKISKILATAKKLQPLIDLPEEYLSNWDEFSRNWKKINELYQTKKTEKENSLNTKTQEQKTKINVTKEEISNLKNELVLLEEQYSENLTQALLRILVFISIFLILFIVRSIISRMIEHLGERYDFPEKKILALHSLKKWTFNVIYSLIILIFFSVQILSILPFLAILGTAVGFALRDVISSFIAWFVVGMKEGYKENDVIKVGDDIYGRVTQITPLITVVQELGMSGPTGKYVTFPNKKIFEVKVQNWLKLKSFTFISIDFFLTQESNIEKARTILLETLKAVSKEIRTFSSRDTTFFKKMGFKEADLKPVTHIDIKQQGIFIRGKIFLHTDEQNSTRTEVVQLFLKKIQKEKDIKILFSDKKAK